MICNVKEKTGPCLEAQKPLSFCKRNAFDNSMETGNSKTTIRKGLFIVIEGIDGTGKTTQAKRLVEYLNANGHPTVFLKEPTEGPIGQKIRELANTGRTTPEQELELFIQDRIENCQKNIGPALKEGKIVVLDRYYFSSVAYQGALGLDPEEILKRNEAIAILPDLVILLDLPVHEGLRRISQERKTQKDLFENEAYLEKVRAIFLQINRPFIHRIDALDPPEKVFEKILGLVKPLLAIKQE